MSNLRIGPCLWHWAFFVSRIGAARGRLWRSLPCPNVRSYCTHFRVLTPNWRARCTAIERWRPAWARAQSFARRVLRSRLRKRITPGAGLLCAIGNWRLSDLQKETEYLKRRKTSLEDQQLEAMMALEEATTRLAVANEEYVVTEAAWKADNKELSQEYDTLKQELTQLSGQRKRIVPHISESDMHEYSALRRLRKGVAVVAVRDGVCQVCRVSVPGRDLERAAQTDELQHCFACDRILYVQD
jgi:DNA repair exonuclease SbcCD ATPase subunit